MSIATVVMFCVKGGKESQFEAVLGRVLESSSNASGFVRCERSRVTGEPRRYLLHEIWTDGAVLDAHVNSGYFEKFVEETSALLETKDVHVLEPF
jgi:quinol monooxygenase YgiN